MNKDMRIWYENLPEERKRELRVLRELHDRFWRGERIILEGLNVSSEEARQVNRAFFDFLDGITGSEKL